jgi:hypothetical protein
MKKLLFGFIALVIALVITPSASATSIAIGTNAHYSAYALNGVGNSNGEVASNKLSMLQISPADDVLIPISGAAYSNSGANTGADADLLLPGSINPLEFSIEGNSGNGYFSFAEEQRQNDGVSSNSPEMSEPPASASLMLMGAGFLGLAVTMSRKAKPSQVVVGA